MEVTEAPERQEVEVITDVYLLRLSEHLLLGDPKGGLATETAKSFISMPYS